MKNTLRQATEVILIGEIPTPKRWSTPLHSLRPGIYAGTLHSNSANQTIDRNYNFFSEERRKQLLMDLSSNLRAIYSTAPAPNCPWKGPARRQSKS